MGSCGINRHVVGCLLMTLSMLSLMERDDGGPIVGLATNHLSLSVVVGLAEAKLREGTRE